MKRLILLFIMLYNIVQAQTTGYFRYDTVRFEKVGANSEFVLRNATRNITGGVLTNMGNGRTAFIMPSPGVIVNLPLYLDGDTAITLNQADNNNDGYLSAGDWDRFDSVAKMWKDTLSTLPAVVPKDNKMVFAKQYLLGPASSISFYNAAWDSDPYPVFWAGPINQNVIIGSRGAATRYLAGTFTGTQNVSIGEFAGGSATTAGNNVWIGRSAGFNTTTGTGNIIIGFNRTSSSTATNTLDIGGWITGQSGWIKIGTGTPLQKLHIGGQLQIDTISNSVDQDSVLTTDGNKVTRMAIANLPGGSASAPAIVSVSSSTTLVAPVGLYNYIEVDATGGAVSLTLPSMTAGKSFVIKKIDASVNAVTFTTDEGVQSITTKWSGARIYRSTSSYRIESLF